MRDVKYCPECDTEYYAHVEECADCGEALKTQKELEELKARQATFEESGQGVTVREGERKWIEELSHVLTQKGFSSQVIGSPNCVPGKCGDSYFLVVPAAEGQGAVHAIEEYYHEAHPQLKASSEASARGKCPACGHDTGLDAEECPDCGLFLIM